MHLPWSLCGLSKYQVIGAPNVSLGTLLLGRIVNIHLQYICLFVFPDEQEPCSRLHWSKIIDVNPVFSGIFKFTGVLLRFPRRPLIWFSFYILEHSSVCFTNIFALVVVLLYVSGLNSAPIAFCCALLMCLPCSLDYYLWEQRLFFLNSTYPVSKALLEIWLASLEVFDSIHIL